MGYVKLPWHVRQYVKAELMSYEKTKRGLDDIHDGRIRSSTVKRLESIDKVFNSLNEYDREVSDLIFIKHYSQARAEYEGVGFKTYYRVMNKVLYQTAIELEII